MLHLLLVKINPEFAFENYLHWFDSKTITRIKQFRQRKDQVVAFTSELIKHYYLANFVDLTPPNIPINYTQYSRPFIANTNIDFNISHSGDYLVVAVSRCQQVGVDIEICNQNTDVIGLGKIVFSDYEQNIVGNSTNNFFTIWTKKEALIKACGTGFGTEDYKNTRLTLQPIEELPHATIYSSSPLPNYYFALCLLK
jgi:4'-phosphopantetheinyl transferase